MLQVNDRIAQFTFEGSYINCLSLQFGPGDGRRFGCFAHKHKDTYTQLAACENVDIWSVFGIKVNVACDGHWVTVNWTIEKDIRTVSKDQVRIFSLSSLPLPFD